MFFIYIEPITRTELNNNIFSESDSYYSRQSQQKPTFFVQNRHIVRSIVYILYCTTQQNLYKKPIFLFLPFCVSFLIHKIELNNKRSAFWVLVAHSRFTNLLNLLAEYVTSILQVHYLFWWVSLILKYIKSYYRITQIKQWLLSWMLWKSSQILHYLFTSTFKYIYHDSSSHKQNKSQTTMYYW